MEGGGTLLRLFQAIKALMRFQYLNEDFSESCSFITTDPS